ncbi:hypothetical protein NMY22_g1421 [Coprinellus aureogranulatus]|nr:hypothetical protein NMY22_g1421 [Coprinellus aureogranulatus]
MDAFTHLTATNIAPTQHESTYVQQILSSKEAAIQKLQAELATCRGVLSPLRRFPLEVLGEIFSAVLTTIEKPVDVPPQVVKICLVCKSWRGAAVVTPRLWNRLAIDLEQGVVCFGRIRSWLDRTGAVPCTIVVNSRSSQWCEIDPYHDEQTCPLLTAGLAELLATSRITIGRLSVACWSEHCLEWLSKRVESLSDIEGRPWNNVRAVELTLPLRFLKVEQLLPYLPNAITSLSLGNLLDYRTAQRRFHGDNTENTPEVLANLKDLTLSVHWPMALDRTFVGLCTNLRSLALYLSPDVDGRLESFHTAITLPHLLHLRVKDVTSDCPILQHLCTPALQQLDLQFFMEYFYYGNEADHEEVSQEIALFVNRSGCKSTLLHIRLASLNITDNGFQYLLKLLPPVTHLTLDYLSGPSRFFQGAVSSGLYDFLPRLEVLEWFHMSEVSEDIRFEDVCHYFERLAYKYPGRTLKKLTLECDPGTQLSHVKNYHVKALKARGVDVKVFEAWE